MRLRKRYTTVNYRFQVEHIGTSVYAARLLSTLRCDSPMKDMLRTLFSIRQKRRTPPVGPVPAVGVSIARGPVKMTINQPVSRDFWNWMVLSGWRNVPVQTDRRESVQLPESSLQQLLEASPQERNAVHARLLALAKQSSSSMSAKSR